MSLPGTVSGTIGCFEGDAPALESYTNDAPGRDLRVLDVQPTVTETGATTGRAACRIEDTGPDVFIDGTLIDIGRTEEIVTVGTEWARRGRVVSAETVVEEGGGAFPFTLLSSVANVRCERLHFDTEAVRRAWGDDGTLSETWLAGSTDDDRSTVMAYGDASSDEPADIGLGFERSWDGWLLRGVVYSSGYVSVYEDLGDDAFLRFVAEELVPHGYVPKTDDAPGEQSTL